MKLLSVAIKRIAVLMLALFILVHFTTPVLRTVIQGKFDHENGDTYHDPYNRFPPSVLNVFRIHDRMSLDDVVSLLGKPQYSSPFSIVSENWITAEGFRVFIQWNGDGSSSDRIGRITILMEENDDTYLILTEPVRMCVVLSLGLLTGALILLRLKKKGILFKKKQVTE